MEVLWNANVGDQLWLTQLLIIKVSVSLKKPTNLRIITDSNDLTIVRLEGIATVCNLNLSIYCFAIFPSWNGRSLKLPTDASDVGKPLKSSRPKEVNKKMGKKVCSLFLPLSNKIVRFCWWRGRGQSWCVNITWVMTMFMVYIFFKCTFVKLSIGPLSLGLSTLRHMWPWSVRGRWEDSF